MNRRKFLQSTIASTAIAATLPASAAHGKKLCNKNSTNLLSCYYFRAHMYTMVPAQVREDLQWMADHGTDAVDIAVLEQDFFAAKENINIIANEAAKLGMKLFIVPSRWGGLVAGAPKVPSLFSVHNPHTWLIDYRGKPYQSDVSGVFSSIVHPEVGEFFKTSIDKAVDLWGIKGVIWDEPKIYDRIDFSEASRKKFGDVPDKITWNQAFHDFWSGVNTHIKNKHPEIMTNLFVYAHMEQDTIEGAGKIKNLDYFGCDGRPWSTNDEGRNEGSMKEGYRKTLLQAGERFLPVAKNNDKKTLWLVENHNMLDEDVALMDKRFPEVLDKEVDHLIYYYYPRNLEDPQRNMNVVGKHILKFKS